MPLFNPNSQNVSVTSSSKLEQYGAQATVTETNANGSTETIAAPEWNIDFAVVYNSGDKDIKLGFAASTNETNFVVNLTPGGTYETPYGTGGDLRAWMPDGAKLTFALFRTPTS